MSFNIKERLTSCTSFKRVIISGRAVKFKKEKVELNCEHTVLNESQFENMQQVQLGSKTGSVYPGCEVHSSSSVQQQGGDIHVTIVSGDVQRGEPTLFETDKKGGGRKKGRGWRKRRQRADCLKQHGV